MYVSNVIADSFKIWHPGERILISAGCGTGKTSFATGPLAEHVRRQGQSILYLSPRKALRHSLVSRRSQRGVCYRTYQSIERELLDGRDPLAGFSYIICDEAHYFTSDSSFNPSTEESWRAISASPAIVVFMTGTPAGLQILSANAGMSLRTYTMPARTDHIRAVKVSKSSAEYMDSIVKAAKAGRQLMAFFRSKADMYTCAGRLEAAKISVEAYDSAGKVTRYDDRGQAVQVPKLPAQVADGYTMSAQVLLSTTYLNSGIELWDREIRDVFTDILDLDEAVQSLYRKRCKPGERITLHIRAYTAAEIARVTADERTSLTQTRTYMRLLQGQAFPDEGLKWSPCWEKDNHILRLSHAAPGHECLELVQTALAHAERACAIHDAVRAGVPYEDMILEALGLGFDTERQGSEAEDRMDEARKWLELHVGQAVDTAELADILAVKAKGHRGYAKSPKALNAAIADLGYWIDLTRAGQKRLRVVQRIAPQAVKEPAWAALYMAAPKAKAGPDIRSAEAISLHTCRRAPASTRLR